MITKSHRVCRSRAGMTLIEVLLVVAILLVIAGTVVPRLLDRQQQASIDSTKLSIKGLEQALKLYAMDHLGQFPTTEQGLDALMLQPPGTDARQWKGPYLEERPLDAWSHEFVYTFPSQHGQKKFDLLSMGSDGIAGNEDDVVNWSTEH